MNYIILQGSSRSDGNSHQIAQILSQKLEARIIDLKKKNIGHYSYENEYAGDDFIPTIKEILEYDTFIFITPVYWYAMSGIMKAFFDRITDCLKSEKETGRKLRGKNMIAISCGSDATKTEGFFVPFRNSAEYLGMNYLGDLHTWVEKGEPGQEVLDRIAAFVEQIQVPS